MMCGADMLPEPSLIRPFDDSPFMPRIECGNWPPWLVSGWVVPSVGLLLLYWCIAGLLLLLWRRLGRDDKDQSRFLPWIAAFFVGCGGGHAMNALSFVWPAYVTFVMWDWFTLVVSAVGTVGVFKIVRQQVRRIQLLESGLHHAIDDREDAQTQAATAREAQEKAESNLRRKFELEYNQNQRRGEELDRIREELSQLVDQQFTEEAYKALRKRLHEVRGTLV